MEGSGRQEKAGEGRAALPRQHGEARAAGPRQEEHGTDSAGLRAGVLLEASKRFEQAASRIEGTETLSAIIEIRNVPTKRGIEP